MWVYIPEAQNIVLVFCMIAIWRRYTFSNLRSVCIVLWQHIRIQKLFPPCFFNQAGLHKQWNGSHKFFSFKKLVLFSSQAYVPQIFPVSGVTGWLLHSSHWQKEAVWMEKIVSFMAYMVTGRTKVWGELAQPVVPERQSSAQLTNSAQQRENVWKSQREECETERERERVWKEKEELC